MPWALGTLDQYRYITDTKRLIVAFFDHYLNDPAGPYIAQWEKVGRKVEVTVLGTPRKAQEHFPAPYLAVSLSGEEVDYSTVPVGQYVHEGEYHKLTLRLVALADNHTGRGITRDDILSAVGKSLAEHRPDFLGTGIEVFSYTGASEESDPAEGIWSGERYLRCDVLLHGVVKKTMVLELAHCTITARDTVETVTGVTLELPQELEVEMLTAARVGFELTVYAVNQDGDTRTLTATVDANTRAQSRLALVSQVAGDEYTAVSSVVIVGGSAGDVFRVQNLAKEL